MTRAMSSRDTILSRIRTALSGEPPVERPPVPDDEPAQRVVPQDVRGRRVQDGGDPHQPRVADQGTGDGHALALARQERAQRDPQVRDPGAQRAQVDRKSVV